MVSEVDHQENRILRLEDGLREVASNAASNGTKLDFVSTQIEHLSKGVTTRLDDIGKHISKNSDRIGFLERMEEARIKRWRTYKKVFLAIFLAICGAAGRILIDVVRAAS